MAEMHKSYAAALFEIAEEEGITDKINEQLKEIAGIFEENREYVALISSPDIPKKERTNLLKQLLHDRYEDCLISFLIHMCKKNVIGEIGGCAEEYEKLYWEFKKFSVAYIKSAIALTQEQKDNIKKSLEDMSGRHVLLECSVEEVLLGGIVAEMDGKIYDGSLKRQLDEIKKVIDR